MIVFLVIGVFVFLVIVAALSLLQLYLSKKKSKWLGLILPMLFIVLSLVWTMTYVNYSIPYSNSPDSQSKAKYDENGNIIEKLEKIDEYYIREFHTNYSSSSVFSGIGIIFVFIAMNIPTVIFLFIYGISREKMRSKLEMQKMAIQDLN